MTGLIQIAQLGTDTGNFDLYSDVNDNQWDKFDWKYGDKLFNN